MRRYVGALVALVVSMVGASSASATYPGANGWISYAGPQHQGQAPDSQLWVIKPDGSDARPVTNTMYLHGTTRWSPDGKLLAISGGNHYARVMTVNASSLRGPINWSDPVDYESPGIWPVQGEGVPLALGLPTWTGDGRQIAAIGQQDTPYDPYSMYIGHTKSQTNQRAEGSPTLKHAWGGSGLHWQGSEPVWSPDGAFFAYEACVEDKCGIWRMKPGDPDSSQLLVGRNDYPVVAPDWSPDSKRIVFQVGHTGGTGEGIWSVNRDGTGLRQISRGGYTPAYSPDGKMIVFSQQNGLYIMNVDGTNHRRIAEGTNLHPDWQRTDRDVSPPPKKADPPKTDPPKVDPPQDKPPVVDPPAEKPPIVIVVPMPNRPATPPNQPRPRLTISRARSVTRAALRQVYKREYNRRRAYKEACKPTARNRASCRVSWLTKRYRYRGAVRITLIRDGGQNVPYYDSKVRRVRR